MANTTSRSNKSEFWASVREITFLLFIVFIVRTIGFGLYQVPTGSMETTMLVGDRFFADKFTPLFTPMKRGNIVSFNDPTFAYSSNFFVNLFQSYVWGPSNWTKRVIGVPGDEVTGIIEHGKPVIYINGNRLNEPYVNSYPLISVLSEGSTQYNDKVRRKSYDPTRPLEQQPFYRMNAKSICKNVDGQYFTIEPGTPMSSMSKRQSSGESYWDKSDEFHVKLGKNQYWVMGDNRLASYDSRSFGPLDARLVHGKIIFRIFSVDTNYGFLLMDIIKNPLDFFKRVRWTRCLQVVS